MSTHHAHHPAAGGDDDPRHPSIVKPLVPIMILGGLLLVLIIAARFFQEEMRAYERRGAAERATAVSPNTAPNDLAEQELMAKRFPDTLLATTGIRYKILREGTGPKPIAGSRVRTHYTGRLLDGTEFDSSLPRGEPFEFKVLAGQVIRGWELTVLEMRVGEKRLVILPSRFAYGTRGSPPRIPPRAPLVFEIELVGFE